MTKLGKLYFDREDYSRLSRVLKQLHISCQTDDGEDDLKKGTQLLEIYALEIQMYTAQKNNKKLKALYDQSLHIKSAIPHPLILGELIATNRNNCIPNFVIRLCLLWAVVILRSFPLATDILFSPF